MNRRGNVFDVLFIGLFVFIFAFAGIIGYIIYSSVNTQIQASPAIVQAGKDNFNDVNTRYPSIIDGIFLMSYVLLSLGAIIGAFMIDTSKVFMFISVIILGLITIVGMFVSNVYREASTNSALADYVANFPIIEFFMTNYVTGFVIIGFSIIIALYAKNRGGSVYA